MQGIGAPACLSRWAAHEVGGAGCHCSQELTKWERLGVSLGFPLLAVSKKHLTELPTGGWASESHRKALCGARRPIEPLPFFLANSEF